jgi:hypothetical protein
MREHYSACELMRRLSFFLIDVGLPSFGLARAHTVAFTR